MAFSTRKSLYNVLQQRLVNYMRHFDRRPKDYLRLLHVSLHVGRPIQHIHEWSLVRHGYRGWHGPDGHRCWCHCAGGAATATGATVTGSAPGATPTGKSAGSIAGPPGRAGEDIYLLGAIGLFWVLGLGAVML
ncbi:hypothetical protein QBC40DRAFT_300815 [Triangularia verruculosa]|uniref:Uncharacterized protein n=1 Tax=Triangularia verruculosa TaxID=2587418 RepID=A0AAN6XA73_9PEZI|nr:hypothetical protein QBC40DRAFT_300815 [Triangularia verruculosa]